MKKTYVLDTSALVDSPKCYYKLNDAQIIIPIVVLSELDSLKKQQNDTGKNARIAIKELDSLDALGSLKDGVELQNGSTLNVDTYSFDFKIAPYKDFGDPNYGDTQILACAYLNWESHLHGDVTLLSNDFNLRIKAKSWGIQATSFESTSENTDDYLGHHVVIDELAGFDLQKNQFIDPNYYGLEHLNPHECINFKNEMKEGLAIGRKVSPNKIKLIKKNNPWGLSPKNKEQTFAIDLLMDRGIDLVTISGTAGTGKNLITLAAGLELVLNQNVYDKLIIYRPTVEIGDGVGFLPGSAEEKILPWMGPIMDNLEVLFSSNHKNWKAMVEMYQKKGKIEFAIMSYMRGRSLPNAFIICDEAQNMTKHEAKTLLTRVGEGTKIVLIGDKYQCDAKNLDSTNNGLSYVVDKFKGSDIYGHITLLKGERSRLATRAAEIL